MARVKRAVNAQKKRRTVLEAASGYRGQRSRLYRKAKEQMLHSMQYAYRDRRDRKGDFRQLWITRINAAARANGMTYNRLIQGLRLAGVEVDRKILADLAVTDEAAFAALVEVARAAVAAEGTGGAADQRPARLSTERLHATGCPEPEPIRSRHGRPGSSRPAGCSAGATATTTGRFLAEGPQAVREALAAGAVVELFGTAEALERHPELVARTARRSVSPVDRGRPWPALAETVTPQGLVAVCRHAATYRWPTSLGRQPRLVAVLVEIARSGQRRHRSCAPPTRPAPDAVVFAGDAVDPYNGKCVRASAGSLFHRGPGRGCPAAQAVARRCARPGCRCWPPTRHGAGRPRRPASTPVRWPRRPRGCSAPRRTACRTTLAAAADAPGAGADLRPGREPEPGGGRRGLPVRFAPEHSPEE